LWRSRHGGCTVKTDSITTPTSRTRETRMQAFKHFITHDWWIAIPMFLMSFTGVMLVIWRLLLNINGSTNMATFLPAFQQKLDKEGVDGAIAYCRKRDD